MKKKLAFVVIEPRNGEFTAFLSIESILSIEGDPELILQKAAEVYKNAVTTMRSLIIEMRTYRVHRRTIPARMMWKLGDAIFQLKDNLEAISLQLDDAYGHFVRDLGVKRKWLGRVVTFRRYLPKEDLIPESLSWWRCKRRTRRIAERLRKGLPPD